MEFNMIILDRKRISVMLLIILVGIFTFSYKTTEKENKENTKICSSNTSSKQSNNIRRRTRNTR